MQEVAIKRDKRNRKGLTLPFNLSRALNLRLVKHLNYQEIAVILGVSKSAIQNSLKELEGLLNRPDLTTAFRENEAELLDSVRLLAIQAVMEQLNDPKRRKTLDLLRLNNLYGTLFDKAQLLRGGATSIIHQLSQIIEQAHTPKPSDAIDVTESEQGHTDSEQDEPSRASTKGE